MFDNPKYIVVCKNGRFEEIFVFPQTQNHRDVAIKLLHTTDEEELKNHVKGAGFISMGITEEKGSLVMRASAYGQSVGLDISSRPEHDTFLANRLFNLIEPFLTTCSRTEKIMNAMLNRINNETKATDLKTTMLIAAGTAATLIIMLAQALKPF